MSVSVKVNSPNVIYGEEFIQSKYSYESTTVTKHSNGCVTVTPYKVNMEVKTGAKVPKIGLMMVGWGGNNGTTLTGMILANKHKLSWHTKTGIQNANFFGAISQVGTFPIGLDEHGSEVFIPVKNMIPLVDPFDIELDGWDISSMNLADGMKRAGVFEWELQEKLSPYMKDLKPRPSAFIQNFVAANQQDRANNIFESDIPKWKQMEQLRSDIRDFKANKNLDKVLVLWVGNTEKYAEIIEGVNDTWDNLEKAIKAGHEEISPSTLYSVAAILENCGYINGSPQNTLVPGVLELASMKGVAVAGDDLKTGQTKLKSVLVDYLIGAGLKPESIVSYNHLGNNDGKNLSAPHTFRSKEISKKGVVEDMVESNNLLYSDEKRPDHLIVIKYVPAVGDSKRAMDEYISSIAMGGLNTLVIHNTCEDSLLAAPIMLDLVIFMELFQRMNFTVNGENANLPMGTLLGYWLKAPITSMTNSLFRQRACIENLLRAAISLPPNNHIHLNIPKESIQPLSPIIPNGIAMHGVKKVTNHLVNGNCTDHAVKVNGFN